MNLHRSGDIMARLSAVFLRLAPLFFVATAASAAAPEVTLTRLDCGTIRGNDASTLSDTHGYDGQHFDFPVSCYLIRHGDDLLLWDAGLSLSLLGVPLSTTAPMSGTVTRPIVDQLKSLGITPALVTRVAVSHFHLDHVGQVGSFPDATLLIGAKDWAAMQGGNAPPVADAGALVHWLKEGGKVQTIAGDLDVFGDGSVMIFATPGHSPGHKSLLVRLAKTGPVLLTGDLFHTRRNYDLNDMASGADSRADNLASMDRFKRSAANLHATVIIGHEAADIAKLPPFPKAAH